MPEGAYEIPPSMLVTQEVMRVVRSFHSEAGLIEVGEKIDTDLCITNLNSAMIPDDSMGLYDLIDLDEAIEIAESRADHGEVMVLDLYIYKTGLDGFPEELLGNLDLVITPERDAWVCDPFQQ